MFMNLLGTITLPELPFDEVATAVAALAVVVIGVGFGVWATPYGLTYAKKIWGKITGR